MHGPTELGRGRCAHKGHAAGGLTCAGAALFSYFCRCIDWFYYTRSETYQYYNLPFCTPKEGKEYKTEGLGEVLEGDRLVSTPYSIKFRVDKENEILCSRELTAKDLKKFRKAVKKDYYFQARARSCPCALTLPGGTHWVLKPFLRLCLKPLLPCPFSTLTYYCRQLACPCAQQWVASHKGVLACPDPLLGVMLAVPVAVEGS